MFFLIGGVDSSLNFEFIGFVVGELKKMRSFYWEVIRGIGERSIHVSRLKRIKKKKLLRLILDVDFPFTAICVHSKFRSISRELSKKTFIPRWKARSIVLKRILGRIRFRLERIGIDHIDTIYVDGEFEDYKNVFRSVFKSRVVPRSFATELADLVAYLNKEGIEKNIYVIEF